MRVRAFPPTPPTAARPVLPPVPPLTGPRRTNRDGAPPERRSRSPRAASPSTRQLQSVRQACGVPAQTPEDDRARRIIRLRAFTRRRRPHTEHHCDPAERRNDFSTRPRHHSRRKHDSGGCFGRRGVEKGDGNQDAAEQSDEIRNFGASGADQEGAERSPSETEIEETATETGETAGALGGSGAGGRSGAATGTDNGAATATAIGDTARSGAANAAVHRELDATPAAVDEFSNGHDRHSRTYGR